MKKMHDKDWHTAWALRQAGWTFRAIAREFGVDHALLVRGFPKRFGDQTLNEPDDLTLQLAHVSARVRILLRRAEELGRQLEQRNAAHSDRSSA